MDIDFVAVSDFVFDFDVDSASGSVSGMYSAADSKYVRGSIDFDFVTGSGAGSDSESGSMVNYNHIWVGMFRFRGLGSRLFCAFHGVSSDSALDSSRYLLLVGLFSPLARRWEHDATCDMYE